MSHVCQTNADPQECSRSPDVSTETRLWVGTRKAFGSWQLMTVTPEQVDEIAEHAHVYMTRDGRISMAGLNDHNLSVSGGGLYTSRPTRY